MTLNRTQGWLLGAIALLGLAIALSVVTVSMTAPVMDSSHPVTADVDGWATWMEPHMTDHMGPESVAWMESHMGATVDQMAHSMAGNGPRRAGMYGQGYGC